jgi:dTDP-4-dehydrorhamnose reductase
LSAENCVADPALTGALYTGLTTNVMSDLVGKLIMDHPDVEGVWHVASQPISKYELLQFVNNHY